MAKKERQRRYIEKGLNVHLCDKESKKERKGGFYRDCKKE